MKNTFDYLLESPATLPLKIAFFVFLALIVYLYVAIRTSLSKVVWRDKWVVEYIRGYWYGRLLIKQFEDKEKEVE